MANQLDELNPEVREEGLDTNVIVKKIPAEVGAGSKFFEIILWNIVDNRTIKDYTFKEYNGV